MPESETRTHHLAISPLQSEDDARACARLMAASEPQTGAFVGFIQTVCIDPMRRGQGLGSTLVEFAERRILKVSPNVFMCVSSFNLDARRLYERLGYKVVGELTDYIVRGHSEFFLRKTVGPLTGLAPKADGKRRGMAHHPATR